MTADHNDHGPHSGNNWKPGVLQPGGSGAFGLDHFLCGG
ncbi:MAG: hypothetical protein QOG22_3776 [Pseudonocardiales bacterium]|nr:hypothetical protein [Pseudonocardiales bacterium]